MKRPSKAAIEKLAEEIYNVCCKKAAYRPATWPQVKAVFKEEYSYWMLMAEHVAVNFVRRPAKKAKRK